MVAKRVCVGVRAEPCGELVDVGPRCPRHEKLAAAPRRAVYDDPRWRRLRADIRREHTRNTGQTCQCVGQPHPGGPWCPGWRIPAHLYGGTLTLDHVIPLERGGAPFDRANLQLLCHRCNSAKRDR